MTGTGSTGTGPTVRSPEPHELEAAIACLEAAFLARLGPSSRAHFGETVESGAMRIALFGDEVAATAATLAVELTLPGGVLAPAAGVTAVAVLPTLRRRGCLRALMGTLLNEAHERGEAFATLYASEGGIYGRFGFGPACLAATYSVQRHAARLRPQVREVPGRVILLSREEAVQVFPPVFDAARLLRAGEVSRPEAWWSPLLDEPEPGREPVGSRFYACYVEQGRVDGYAAYEVPPLPVQEGGERHLELLELVATTDPAYRALWAYLLEIDLVDGVVTERRPLDEPLRFLLEDPRALRTRSVGDHTWLRLIDVPAALAARRYAGPGRLTLEVSDALCPWNAGRYLLEVDGAGRAAVEVSTEAADLACDSATLAAAYLGGPSWRALAAGSRVGQVVEGGLARADALFGTGLSPFCTADF